MASGKPIIGVLDKGSEARLIIEECNCGICIEPGNYEEVYEKINYILENKQSIKSLGINGRVYLERNITKEVAINKYKTNILEIDKSDLDIVKNQKKQLNVGGN